MDEHSMGERHTCACVSGAMIMSRNLSLWLLFLCITITYWIMMGAWWCGTAVITIFLSNIWHHQQLLLLLFVMIVVTWWVIQHYHDNWNDAIIMILIIFWIITTNIGARACVCVRQCVCACVWVKVFPPFCIVSVYHKYMSSILGLSSSTPLSNILSRQHLYTLPFAFKLWCHFWILKPPDFKVLCVFLARHQTCE